MTNYNRFNPPTFVNNASQHSNGQQDRRVSGDMNGLGAMNGGIIATSHPAFQVQSLQQSQQQQSRLGDAGLVQGRKDLSRHNSATQFATPTDTMDASLQQAMMDFGNAQNNPSLSQFVFNPAMGTSMNNNLTGQYDVQMSQLHGQGNASNVPLSINTQYNNLMGYNGLSATSNNYQSPFDADMSSTFMNTGGDMSMDLSMMNDEEIAVINDLFSAQQFGSPSFTSPMNSTFDASMYGPQASGTIGNMDAAQMNIMVPNLPSSNIQLDESQSHVTELRKNSMQSEDEIILPDNKQEVPASTIASNPTNRKSKTQMTHETIGGIKLPWMTPAEGWPSTMQGRKPHMYTPYRDAYAPSGFDLMDTLVRVKNRPDKQIEIGAVDLSCAFVVCDAKTHDNPIIYCSESFERMTGYTRFEIKGQNCRFLQSPTGKVEAGLPRKYCDDESVLYLKNCVTTRTEAQISLINYRKGGQPFMNLLTMIPIMDDHGDVLQFVGFQVDLVENPTALSGRNDDGSYNMDYTRKQGLPAYHIQPRDPVAIMEQGRSITRDEVSTLLSTLATPENDLSKRMIDKMILENSDDVIHVLSLKGLFLYLSPSCGRILEYEPSALVGMALSSICHPSDIVPVTRELKETQSGASVTVVYRIRRRDSGYVWFESHGCLHTEQGKGRKCIILVGRIRPVYTLSKQVLKTAGGIGEHEMWSKMSTTGMFLFLSEHVKGLLDQHPDDLIGTSFQAIMRTDSKAEFNRMLTIVLTGEKAELRHEVINRRGQVLQATTWLYPGDASPGKKPTFIIAQTRLVKYNRAISRTASQPGAGTEGSISTAGTANQTQNSKIAPTSGSNTMLDRHRDSSAVVVSRAGTLATPLGEQNESLASADNAFEELKTTRCSSWQYELRQLERRNRLLAEEVQQLLASKKKRKRRRGAGMMQKDCANCHTTSTPEWRRGPSGNRDLCNSCGLRYAKAQGRVSPRTNTSPRHSISNDSKGESAAQQKPSPLNREGSGNSSVSKASTNHTTMTGPSNTDKRSTPEGGATADPTPTKVLRTSGSNLPHRIEEEDEPAEQQR